MSVTDLTLLKEEYTTQKDYSSNSLFQIKQIFTKVNYTKRGFLFYAIFVKSTIQKVLT